MMRTKTVAGALALAFSAAALAGCATSSGGAGAGNDEQPDEKEQAAMKAIGAKADGKIVRSSSRLNNHDLFVMNNDGSNVHNITKGDAENKNHKNTHKDCKILFTRIIKGWVF